MHDIETIYLTMLKYFTTEEMSIVISASNIILAII